MFNIIVKKENGYFRVKLIQKFQEQLLSELIAISMDEMEYLNSFRKLIEKCRPIIFIPSFLQKVVNQLGMFNLTQMPTNSKMYEFYKFFLEFFLEEDYNNVIKV